ncbi:hypothetical protein EVAR_11082_1 [Eumeta japonica]|uniref:YqaJ viral recombinase domain-containing protein n=1 Tax=Eumeta variegata TaxID=151549 RepID=A0A4C1U423_EUMVA|nr:hypothetical protein EVAR_11082_1 [Eumeta japonica]
MFANIFAIRTGLAFGFDLYSTLRFDKVKIEFTGEVAFGHYSYPPRPPALCRRGPTRARIDLTSIEHQELGRNRLVADKDTIEKETVLQAESALWLELKRCLLTASNFGKVCKRRCNISSAPLSKTLLYSYSIGHLPAIQNGKIYEATALKQLEKQENIVIHKCGLFIDNEHFFLGASSDAVFSDGIIEIKCPKSAFCLHPDDAIKEKKIRMWKTIKNNVVLNKSHDWYYQVQGQLYITKKDKCLFAVWTGSEHPLKTALIERDDTF